MLVSGLLSRKLLLYRKLWFYRKKFRLITSNSIESIMRFVYYKCYEISLCVLKQTLYKLMLHQPFWLICRFSEFKYQLFSDLTLVFGIIFFPTFSRHSFKPSGVFSYMVSHNGEIGKRGQKTLSSYPTVTAI